MNVIIIINTVIKYLIICFRVCLYVRGVEGELAGGGLKPGPAGKARKIFREIGVRIFLQNDAKS